MLAENSGEVKVLRYFEMRKSDFSVETCWKLLCSFDGQESVK